MSEEKMVVGEEHNDDIGVTIRWKADSYYLEFEAKEQMPQGDGTRLYSAEENGPVLPQDTFEKGERLVSGTVKWDGCSHFWFGDKDGYLHLCGVPCFSRLLWTICRATELAMEHVDMDHCALLPIPKESIP